MINFLESLEYILMMPCTWNHEGTILYSICSEKLLIQLFHFYVYLNKILIQQFVYSGKTVRQFVPISRILKPVLTECVTPVTCYWSLSLIIRGEEELMLVFKVKFISLLYFSSKSLAILILVSL